MQQTNLNSINLNRVECKPYLIPTITIESDCINLNRVECKQKIQTA